MLLASAMLGGFSVREKNDGIWVWPEWRRRWGVGWPNSEKKMGCMNGDGKLHQRVVVKINMGERMAFGCQYHGSFQKTTHIKKAL